MCANRRGVVSRLGCTTPEPFTKSLHLPVSPPAGKPTPDDMEEMLVPYSPFVPIIPTAVLSYNKTVHQLRGFAVAPARIESTSLMLAYNKRAVG